MAKRPAFGQLKLRLPDTLRKALEEAAEKSGKSLNAEIIWRLSKSLEAPEAFAEFEAGEVERLKALADLLRLPPEARERLFKELVESALGRKKR
jgi:hypothetical protein